MRASLTALLATALLSSAALAADIALPQGTPPSVVNPPAAIPNNDMSLDKKLPADGSLHNDAETMKAIEATTTPVDPAAARVEAAKDTFLRANNQLGADIRNHASKETIKKDRLAVEEAKKHLSLDETACSAEAKAQGTAMQGCK